jgi:hypothetical protein
VREMVLKMVVMDIVADISIMINLINHSGEKLLYILHYLIIMKISSNMVEALMNKSDNHKSMFDDTEFFTYMMNLIQIEPDTPITDDDDLVMDLLKFEEDENSYELPEMK